MNHTIQSIVRFLATPKGRLLGVLVLVPVLFFVLGGGEWLSLEAFHAHRVELLDYAERHFWKFLIVWGLLYAATVTFSIPGGALLSLVTGFLFGRWVGTALIVVSATLGAVAVFAAARYLFADEARQRLEQSPLAAKILAGFERDAPSYLLFLRLVPAFPFWLVNLAPAFTSVTLRTYALTTAVGIIPGSFVFANLGRSLGQIDSLKGLVSGEVLFSLALLGALALLPALLKPVARKFGFNSGE